MIFWNVIYYQSGMGRNKVQNPLSFMPTRLVNKKLEDNVLISRKNALEHSQKSIGITSFLAYHSVLSSNWVNPPKYIETFMMLAFRQNNWLFPLLYPNSSQLGVKAKARFIRKKQHPFPFTSFDLKKFFLTSFQIPQPLPWWPAHNGKLVAATKTLTGVPTAVPAELSALSPVSAPGILPRQLHPTGFVSNPIPEDCSLMLPLKLFESGHQSRMADRGGALLLIRKALPHLPSESISPHSNDSRQTVWQFEKTSSLLKPKEWQRYENRSRPLESPLPSAKGLLGLLMCWLWLMLSCFFLLKKMVTFQEKLYSKIILCQLIYDVHYNLNNYINGETKKEDK